MKTEVRPWFLTQITALMLSLLKATIILLAAWQNGCRLLLLLRLAA